VADTKIVYRRYASLFFIAGCDSADNELITLEVVHRFVEQMDKYYGNVCELDIIFNFQKAYFILDELLLAGEMQESSKKNVLRCISQQDGLEDMEVSATSSFVCPSGAIHSGNSPWLISPDPASIGRRRRGYQDHVAGLAGRHHAGLSDYKGRAQGNTSANMARTERPGRGAESEEHGDSVDRRHSQGMRRACPRGKCHGPRFNNLAICRLQVSSMFRTGSSFHFILKMGSRAWISTMTREANRHNLH
jgi:hypothetical protein